MSCHMTLHEDVLERILNILKQDDYYRTLEDLPGKTERGKKKDERRKGAKERRQKMSGKMQKSTKK